MTSVYHMIHNSLYRYGQEEADHKEYLKTLIDNNKLEDYPKPQSCLLQSYVMITGKCPLLNRFTGSLGPPLFEQQYAKII